MLKKIELKHVTVEMSIDETSKLETKCVTINVRDNVTHKRLANFDVFESKDLKEVFLSKMETIKRL